MKVLHLNDHLDHRGGIETYMLGLIPRLIAAGIEPVVGFGNGRAELAPRAIRIPELTTAPRRHDAAGRNAIRRVLASEQPDIVHLHNIQNVDIVEECLDTLPVLFTAHDYRYACPASTFYYKKSKQVCERTCGPGCFAVTLKHHCLTPRPLTAWAFYRRVRRIERNAERFAAVIAPSESAAGRMLAAGFTRDQVRVLPYFCPIPPRREPRPVPAQPHILFVGRLSDNKGWEYFVRALGRLPNHIQGTMVGSFNAGTTAQVQRLANECGCGERIRLRGWAGREEIQAIMESASVLVFPSIWAETLGIVGLEALASGVPVVASDIGGVREWLLPGQTGLLVPPKDDFAIAEAVQHLLEDPKHLRDMGAAGITLIENKFSPDQHVSSLLNVYRHAAGSRRSLERQPVAVTA